LESSGREEGGTCTKGLAFRGFGLRPLVLSIRPMQMAVFPVPYDLILDYEKSNYHIFAENSTSVVHVKTREFFTFGSLDRLVTD
jgi:hypothetical protein